MIVLVISNAWGSASFRPNCSHVISEKVAKLYAFYPCVKKNDLFLKLVREDFDPQQGKGSVKGLPPSNPSLLP